MPFFHFFIVNSSVPDTMALPAKRKRATLSYAEEDEELGTLLGVHEKQEDGETAELEDEIVTVTFGKKVPSGFSDEFCDPPN